MVMRTVSRSCKLFHDVVQAVCHGAITSQSLADFITAVPVLHSAGVETLTSEQLNTVSWQDEHMKDKTIPRSLAS